MKSKFLFSGKSISTGDTVLGSLVYSAKENQYYIVEQDGEELSWEVYEDSIKQVFSEKCLGFREQLEAVKGLDFNLCDLEIANECDCVFNFEYTDEQFEELCEYAKAVYLESAYLTPNAIAQTISDLISNQEQSIEQLLEMDYDEFSNKASYYC